jgi:hypothetical protein
MMTKLFNDILEECEVRGEVDRDKSRCLYAKAFDCTEESCVILRQFRGKRPKDMVLERTNLRKQYEEEMA